MVGTSTRRGRLIFHLAVPNQEVLFALHDQLFTGYTGIENERLRLQDGLYAALTTGDVSALLAAIRRLFAGIPWRNFTGNDLAEAEGYYASVPYAFLASLDAQVIPRISATTARWISPSGSPATPMSWRSNCGVTPSRPVPRIGPRPGSPLASVPWAPGPRMPWGLSRQGRSSRMKLKRR